MADQEDPRRPCEREQVVAVVKERRQILIGSCHLLADEKVISKLDCAAPDSNVSSIRFQDFSLSKFCAALADMSKAYQGHVDHAAYLLAYPREALQNRNSPLICIGVCHECQVLFKASVDDATAQRMRIKRQALCSSR